MNICLVSQDCPPDTARGGIGTQTWNKAWALAELGHTVHVLSRAAGPGPDLKTETTAGVTVHRMQAPGKEPGREFPVYNPATYWMGYTWSVLRHLHHLVQRSEFDVIDFPEYGAEGFAYLLDRGPWNWVPVVVQLHGPLAMLTEHIGWPEAGSDFHRVGTFMEELSIRRADSLMACSANIANFTAQFYGVRRDSIAVVQCGVDAAAFHPDGERHRLEGPPTVLFVGNISASKGVPTVLDAVLRLRTKYPDIRLQIVGGGEPDLLNALQHRTAQEGAASHVEWHGFVDRAQLPIFYRRAHVFCSPAQYEGGVANVYLEAMACACPVVASTAGGAPEAVVDGETGLLVPPCDVAAVVGALDRILSDASMRRRMGEAGRRRVEDHFTMDKYISRVLRVYRAAATSPRVSREQLPTGSHG